MTGDPRGLKSAARYTITDYALIRTNDEYGKTLGHEVVHEIVSRLHLGIGVRAWAVSVVREYQRIARIHRFCGGCRKQTLATVLLPMAEMDFGNTTHLSDQRLRAFCDDAVHGWAVGRLRVRFRYSRGADFSGTCFYGSHRIFVNIGRHVKYPYRLATHVGRAKTIGRRWYKPGCIVRMGDEYALAMFIFMHELYHLLVKRARRNTRQKESMCDRFATRFVVDRFGLCVETARGVPIPRAEWDFQDLDDFVAAARDRRVKRMRPAARRPLPSGEHQGQLLLFPEHR